MSNIEKHNSCLLSICDKDDVIIRVVNIDPNEIGQRPNRPSRDS